MQIERWHNTKKMIYFSGADCSIDAKKNNQNLNGMFQHIEIVRTPKNVNLSMNIVTGEKFY